jgi:hypothetical protein
MAIVVGELIAMVFVDIELLILDLPARPPELYHHRHLAGVHIQVGNPTVMIELFALRVLVPDFHLVHAHGTL